MVKIIIEFQVPPYNGFGTEEDTLCSCAGLIPKPPQRDFVKFMALDRYIQLKSFHTELIQKFNTFIKFFESRFRDPEFILFHTTFKIKTTIRGEKITITKNDIRDCDPFL